MYIAGIKSNVSRKIDCERRDMPSAIRSENMELRSENHQIQPDGVLGNEAQHFLGPVGGVIGTLGLVWGAFSGGVPTPDAGSNIIDGLDANGIVAECPPGMALAPVYEGEGSEEICTEGGMPLNSQEYFLIQNFGVDWRQNPAFSNLEPDEFPPILQ